MENIFCFWERDKLRNWKLVACHGVDDDGYTTEKEEKYDELKNKFLYTNSDDYDAISLIPRMNRAITMWNFYEGITLRELQPPDWVNWLTPLFYENLRKNPKWWEIIDGGSVLLTKTKKIVVEMLEKYADENR